MPADYYGVLGVSPSATAEEIKRSYKKLAVKFHPDKTNDPSLHSKFLLINEAYETLKDTTLRKSYDVKNGFAGLVGSASNGVFNNPYQNDGFRSHHGFSYYLTTSRNGGASYFNWQQLNARTYADAYFRSSRHEKEEAAAAAAMAAKLARKQMEEEMKRRQEEYMREARRMREKEQLEEVEARLRERMEARERQMREEAERTSHKTEHLGEQYRQARQRAFQRLWHGSNGSRAAHEQPGYNSSEPIIVEDEVGSSTESESDDSGEFHDANVGDVESVELDDDETEDDEEDAGWEDDVHELDDESGVVEDSGISDAPSGLNESRAGGFDDVQSEPPSTKTSDESLNQDQDGPDANGANSDSPKTPHDGPEVVEVPEEGEFDGVSGSKFDGMGGGFSAPEPKGPHRKPYNMASPQANVNTREHHEQRRREASAQHVPNSAKKPRFADMSELRDTLGTNIDDVSFDDMRENLPETGQKTRKASGSVQSSFKRARTEFTDGTSRAQTLFTPINKASARFSNSTISPSDLAPDIDESSIIFTAKPPHVDVGLSLTHTQWDQYVQNIHSYERKFAEYRKAVLRYQTGRLEKDERHHNIIYSDTSCVEAYQSCLFNDMLILQNYTRMLVEFRETLETFKRNCDVVNAMKA